MIWGKVIFCYNSVKYKANFIILWQLLSEMICEWICRSISHHILTVLSPYLVTHTRLTALCPGLPGWAGTRKVKPIWILLKQETVSGSGISWAVCKSATRSRQITMPALHHSVFYRPDALPAAQPTASKHLVKLVIFYTIPILLIFWGKVTTQLMCGGIVFDTLVCKSFLITTVKEYLKLVHG